MSAIIEAVGHLFLITALGGTVHILFKAVWLLLPQAEKEITWRRK